MSEETTFILTDELTEHILLKKVLTDASYVSFFTGAFDKRWLKDNDIGALIKICVSYHKTYESIPNKETLFAIIEKYSKDNEKIKKREVDLLSKYEHALTLPNYGEEAFIKDILFKYLKRRAIYFTILDNIERVEKNEDVGDLVTDLTKIINFTIDNERGSSYFDDIQKHLENLKNPLSRLSTGFHELDKLFNGGLLKTGRCLFVPMAQPGLGKSLLLSNIAVYTLMQNKVVVIISLEMSEDVYMQRIDAHITGSEINSICKNTTDALDKISAFKKKYPKSQLYVKEYPPSTITTCHIEAYVNKLIAMGAKPDLLLVDYTNILLPKNMNSKMSMYERVGEVAKELRALSYKFEIPVISPVQANREGTNNESIGLEHVAESSGVSQHADAILALYQTPEDILASRISAKMLKNRLGGRIGSCISFQMNPQNLILTNNKIVVKNELEKVENEILQIGDII